MYMLLCLFSTTVLFFVNLNSLIDDTNNCFGVSSVPHANQMWAVRYTRATFPVSILLAQP